MITQIHIAGYKSLADVTVDLEPVTVLIGKSGTGKSNFLDAIQFLRNCLLTSPGQRQLSQPPEGWNRIFSATRQGTKTLQYAVQFRLDEANYQYRLAIGSPTQRDNEMTVLEESLLVDDKFLFGRLLDKWHVPPAVTNPPNPAVPFVLLGAIPGLQESSLAYSALAYGMGCHRFSDNVLFARTGPEQGPQLKGLNDGAENYLSTVAEIFQDLKHFRSIKQIASALRVIKPSLRSLTINQPTNNQVDTAHTMPNSPLLTFDITQESEGFRRLFACLLALYQRPPKQLLLFDEPEKGIYPAGLSVLADEFKNCAEQDRGQVILTTHSPDFLDHFAPEQIRVVEMKNYETVIGPVAEDQMSALKEHFLTPGELLTVTTAQVAEAVGG